MTQNTKNPFKGREAPHPGSQKDTVSHPAAVCPSQGKRERGNAVWRRNESFCGTKTRSSTSVCLLLLIHVELCSSGTRRSNSHSMCDILQSGLPLRSTGGPHTTFKVILVAEVSLGRNIWEAVKISEKENQSWTLKSVYGLWGVLLPEHS